jgi:CheY-like chemotaxis protein
MLEKEGCAVSEAGNGIEGLASMERDLPSLILLDLMMPEMDGFAFAAEVRRHREWRSIPIVVLTSQDLTHEDRRRLNGNVETVVMKQGDSGESLLVRVRDLLADISAARAPRELAGVGAP